MFKVHLCGYDSTEECAKTKQKIRGQSLIHHHTETPLRTEGLSLGYFEFLNTISLLHPVNE